MADKDAEHQRTWQEFGDAVNMTASQLAKWLDDDLSKSVGQNKGRQFRVDRSWQRTPHRKDPQHEKVRPDR